jgi:serine O-acetyltransferase
MFPRYSPLSMLLSPSDRLLEIASAFRVKLMELVCWAIEQFPQAVREQFPDEAIGPQLAYRLVQHLIEAVPEINRQLRTDVEATVAGDPACQGPEEVIICYPGFQAILVHRLSHALYRLQVPLIPRMLSEWVHSATGIDIHPGAVIGDYFFIDHGTGVVIGQTCHVGSFVRIYQGVTLGALSFAKDEQGNLVRNQKRHPTLEDYVIVYANSTILGGNTIVGHHSVIGSSVWLTESVQPYTTVVMEKPKLRFRNQNATAFDAPPDYII